MKLKKLEIYGFKSFAQRTEIVFNEGITGIVGPNGSGKSNIGDAVRWVLGEQSAKTLRGAKMEDVIFNGTQKRKPLSYCEVSLVFDNEDRALPMDFAEVAVTRRVYRNGESEYYLNRSACRLKDIIDCNVVQALLNHVEIVHRQSLALQLLNDAVEALQAGLDGADGVAVVLQRELLVEHVELRLDLHDRAAVIAHQLTVGLEVFLDPLLYLTVGKTGEQHLFKISAIDKRTDRHCHQLLCT